MDPTNPLSVAPPRYKYHPNPETITNFPTYRTDSDVESPDDETEQDESDGGSDFSDEEDRMPDVKAARPTPAYGEQSATITWRKGHSTDTVNGVTKTLIAVNQVALVLSRALEHPRKPSAQVQEMVKVGYVTLQQPNSGSDESKHRRSPRKVFSLWISGSASARTLLAIQVGRVFDRAVHIVSKALTETITHQEDGDSETFVILDTYIPQTYVPSTRPDTRLYLDNPPVRFLSAKKKASVVADEGIEKFESPNYVTGMGAGVLPCSAEITDDRTLLLLPKPFDGHTIIRAINAAPGFRPIANVVKAAFQAADMDWEEVNASSTGVRRSGRRGNSRAHGIIGDGGMYV